MTRFLSVFVLCFASVVLAEQFVSPVTDLSQLGVEQEMQRRYADVFGGLNQAHHFYTMGSLKYSAGVALAQKAQRASLEEESFLELKEEFFPFAGYGGYPGYGYGAQVPPQEQPQSSIADAVRLEKHSTNAKISALKYFFVQLLSTQSDVQAGYWINKGLSLAAPSQFSVFKLYKNYLSTFALSSALQLHDSYTLEAYLETFNRKFTGFGKSPKLAEAVAEYNVYTQWQTLVQMRLFLFYISLYEQSAMAQTVAQPPPTTTTGTTGGSFLELDLELDPAKPQDTQNYMLMQYVYVAYFARILKFYTLFTEMMIPSQGLHMASVKVHGYRLLTDSTPSNDDDGRKFVDQAEKMDSFAVHGAITQWAGLVRTRYFLEFYCIFFEMYLPQLSTQRVLERIDSAMLNTQLMQLGKAQTTKAESH